MTPVFILSLPRSGSTLLQRMLASAPGVTTSRVAEPHFLLELMGSWAYEGTRSVYGARSTTRNCNNFIKTLPNQEDDWYRAIRCAANSLYNSAAVDPGARYFIDKTPRYCLVASHLRRIFPEAKFIFLWRHPLDVLTSVVQTWGRGKWRWNANSVELFLGIHELYNAEQMGGENQFTIRYEDLISKPNEHLASILEFLEIGQVDAPDLIDGFKTVSLEGAQDPKSREKQNQSLHSSSLDQWKEVINNAWRKTMATHYLDWIGTDKLISMGYDPQADRQFLVDCPRAWGKSTKECLEAYFMRVKSLLAVSGNARKNEASSYCHRVLR